MLQKIIRTDGDAVGLVLRLGLAVVMFPHGAQKLLGWFGGPGFSGTMSYFTDSLGVPWILGLLAVLTEFLGSIGLAVGLLTRVAALGIGVNMVVAVLMVHLPNGFFMNWFGAKSGEGFEYHILALAIVIAVVIVGGGRWSADRALTVRTAPGGE
jgi:putative oxidoreductase